MGKHTPGPWLAVSNRGNTALSCISYPDGHTIATCNNVSVGDWEANAHLIAAAPELREAGALALNHLSYALQRASLEWDNVAITSIGTAMSKLRAALAKADGKP